MPNLTASLARHVPADTVLELLGAARGPVPQAGPALCPLCQRHELNIYPDGLLGGEWVYCSACRFAGDPIELGMKALNIDVATLLSRVAKKVPELTPGMISADAIAAYQLDHLDQRRHTNQIWATVCNDLPFHEPGSLTRLQRQATAEAGQRGSGALPQQVGYATRRDAEELFHPQSYAPKERVNRDGEKTLRRGSGAGKTRLFREKGWDAVTIVPSYDMPGRICGFWMGKDEPTDPPQMLTIYQTVPLPPDPKVIFRAAPWAATNQKVKESGVLLLDNAYRGMHPGVPGLLLILPDIMLALRLHFRWLKDHSTPLPIVTTFENEHFQSRHVWPCLPTQRVLWAPTIGAKELIQAKVANAQVSLLRSTLDDLFGPFAFLPNWLNKLAARAVSWQEALASEVNRLQPAAAAALIAQVAAHTDPVRDLQQVRPHLNAPSTVPALLPRAQFDGQTIVERDGAWFVERSKAQVCDGQPRIEQVVQTRQGADYYRGYLVRGETKLPFLLSIESIKKRGLLHCLADEVERAGGGKWDFSPRWSGASATIALRMHPAAFLAERDVVGWCDTRFAFPQFAIKQGGRIEAEGAFVAGPDAPCQAFRPPVPFNADELRVLTTRSRENRLFWATVAAVATNVFAPVLRLPPIGIGLVGQGAQVIAGHAARLLGCHEFVIPPRRSSSVVLERVAQVCSHHEWPVILTPPAQQTTKPMRDLLHYSGPKNCVLPLYDDASAQLALRMGWMLIRSPWHSDTLKPLEQLGPRVMPNFLHHVCRKHMGLSWDSNHRLQNMLWDLAAWIGEQGGDKESVLRAAPVLVAEGFPAAKRAWQPLRRTRRVREWGLSAV